MNAQDYKNQESLTLILNKLEQQFNVEFNYADDVIKNIVVIPPTSTLNLIDALNYLQDITNLQFTLTNDRIILVKPLDYITVCGYVKDKETAQPLALATVQTNTNSTITDDKGFFKIKTSKKSESILISFLGYKTHLTTANILLKANCDTLFLIPNVQSLSEIIISNYITSGINKINNGSYEIKFSDFDILPGQINNDVLQSVQAFPGIQSINETVSNINIRGGTHDQNLILWDGIKMYQSGHFFGLISMYNPQITEVVSLRKNGSDVSYTDGVSGTIAMETKQSINTKLNTTFGINLTDANTFIDAPLGNSSSIQIAARKSINNLFKTPTYNAFFDRISQNTEVSNNTTTINNSNKSFDFYDASIRWIYKINAKDELRINFITVNNKLQFNENAQIDNLDVSKESKLTQNSIAGALHYKRIWNDKWQTLFEAYETDYKLKAINANILDSQRFLQENIVSETSIKLINNYTINNTLNARFGYHFVETKVTNLDDVDTPLYLLLISEVVRTHGIFSQFGFTSLNNTTNLNFGMRYNYIEKFKKSILEPRLSFSHRFLNFFTFEVLGEFKHQNTSQVINFQNDFLGIEKRRWQLSNNDNIPIIKSKQASVGLTFNQKGWLINIDGYTKQIKGITAQSQGFQNQFEFSKNSGENQVNGIDLLIRKYINHYNFWLSYSYMNNKYMFKNLTPNYFPSNYNVTNTTTLGITYSLNNLKLSGGLNWHSGKPTTKPIQGNEILNNEVNYEVANASNLDHYFRVDISALYNFKLAGNGKLNIGFSIWNVLNKENQINKYYKISDGELNEINQISLGFTPNAVMRIDF